MQNKEAHKQPNVEHPVAQNGDVQYCFIYSQSYRVNTFNVPGWCNKTWFPCELAEAGFYYSGHGHVVRCFACRLSCDVSEWECDSSCRESPSEAHARLSPNCRHVTGNWYKPNASIDRKKSGKVTDANTSFDDLNDSLCCVSEHRYNENRCMIRRTNPDSSSRENSVQTINALTDAGFIFTATGNSKEGKQSKDEDPLEIKEINRQLKQKMKCIYCKTADVCILFVNCGHRITCETCADFKDVCLICDKRIKKRMKTFLS